MREEFEPDKFIEFLSKDLDKIKNKQGEIERYFMILKDFFGDIYYHSETFEKDKRKKPRDNLLFVEDRLEEVDKNLKILLSQNTYNELKKLFRQIKERHDSPFGREINFIWNSAGMKDIAKETLVLLKDLQKKKLPEVYLPYAIDYD